MRGEIHNEVSERREDSADRNVLSISIAYGPDALTKQMFAFDVRIFLKVGNISITNSTSSGNYFLRTAVEQL